MTFSSVLWPLRESLPEHAFSAPDPAGAWLAPDPLIGEVLHADATPLARPSGVFKAFSFGDLVYGQLHVMPSVIDVGLLTQGMTYQCLLWNAFPVAQTVSTLRHNYEGISDTAGSSIGLAALEERVFSVTVSMQGTPDVDGVLLFSVDGVSVPLTITGSRGLVWGLAPERGLAETWEWLTHIVTGLDHSEERRPLRDVPRVSYGAAYAAVGREAAYAESLVYSHRAGSFVLPLFEQAVRIPSPAAGSERLAFDTSGGAWRDGGRGILWRDALTFESFSVASASPDGLILKKPLARALGGMCLAVPCADARIEALSRTDEPADASALRVQWAVTSPLIWAERLPESTYDGFPLLDLPAYVTGEGLSRDVSVPKVLLDNGLGPARTLNPCPYARATWSVLVPCRTREEIAAMRGALMAWRGGCAAFWLSTGRHDFVPAGDYRQTVGLAVRRSGWASSGLAPGRDRIRIELADGSVFVRRIVSIAAGPAAEEILSLDEGLPFESLPAAAFRVISFLTLVRLAGDNALFTWRYTQWAADVTFSVVEVDA